MAMSERPRFDISVILPFGDDEEAVGIAVKRTAEHLRSLGLSFEILAIDEDSGDNSHAVLALLRAEVPELRVTHAPGRGRGVDIGAGRAQGTLLLIATLDVASASLDDRMPSEYVHQRTNAPTPRAGRYHAPSRHGPASPKPTLAIGEGGRPWRNARCRPHSTTTSTAAGVWPRPLRWSAATIGCNRKVSMSASARGTRIALAQ